jgi:DNA-directed RNA polymerase specialized sigma24 family protein
MSNHLRDFRASKDQLTDAAVLAALRRLSRPVHRAGRPVTIVEQRAIIAAGWAVIEPQTGTVRLTAAGRTILRRALSDGGLQGFTATLKHVAQDRGARSGALPSGSSVLRWLRQRKDRNGLALLTEVQAEAGERLAADFVRGQMMPRVTADWSLAGGNSPRRRGVPGHGVEMREGTSAAQDRFRAAVAAVEPEFADLLINVCCFDQRIDDIEKAMAWPQRSAKLLLHLALNQLARHYGMIARAPNESTIRHSGSDDYRPTLDTWSQ